jgi:hypothetical protein
MNAFRKAALLLLTLPLAGCVDWEARKREEQEAIERRLPPGCKFLDLGYYGRDRQTAVVCGGASTSSAIHTELRGKTHYLISLHWINL